MSFFNDDERRRLVANARRAVAEPDYDPVPVARLFTPDGRAMWLVTELDPDDEDLAYGLCDAGMGLPEIGHFRLSTLAQPTGALGMRVERDRRYRAEPGLTLAVLDRLAAAAGRIVG